MPMQFMPQIPNIMVPQPRPGMPPGAILPPQILMPSASSVRNIPPPQSS